MSEAGAPHAGHDPFDDPAALAEHKIPGWMAFGVNILIFALESGYLLWILRNKSELEYFLLLHGAVVLGLIFWLGWCKRTYKAYLFPTVTLVFVAGMGPLGALGSAYAKLVHAFFLRGRGPFDTILGVLFPDEPAGGQKFVEGLVRLDPGADIEEAIAPLRDIMAHGGRDQKMAALMLVTRHFVPPFAPILKLGRRDGDAEVRAAAEAAMHQLDLRLREDARELEQDLTYHRDDENLLALALHYDQWAWADLSDAAHRRQYADLAMAHYRTYLARHPHDTWVIKEVGRLLYRGGDLAAALAWFDSHRHVAAESPAFLAWYLELLFHHGRYADIRALTVAHGRALQAHSAFPHRVREALAVWTAAAGGAA